MSDAIFPTLPGLTFDMKCNSRFKTVVHESAAGGESRAGFSAYPWWLFTLNYEFLDDSLEGEADLETLHGFILQRRGSFDSFLYDYPRANTVVNQPLGNGNGVITEFQLKRRYGGFDEPVHNHKPDATLLTKVNKEFVVINPADYTLDVDGLVTFAAPPADGYPVFWSGGYYFRCRFESDDTDFTEFAYKLYSHQDFQFRGSTVNKA